MDLNMNPHFQELSAYNSFGIKSFPGPVYQSKEQQQQQEQQQHQQQHQQQQHPVTMDMYRPEQRGMHPHHPQQQQQQQQQQQHRGPVNAGVPAPSSAAPPPASTGVDGFLDGTLTADFNPYQQFSQFPPGGHHHHAQGGSGAESLPSHALSPQVMHNSPPIPSPQWQHMQQQQQNHRRPSVPLNFRPSPPSPHDQYYAMARQQQQPHHSPQQQQMFEYGRPPLYNNVMAAAAAAVGGPMTPHPHPHPPPFSTPSNLALPTHQQHHPMYPPPPQHHQPPYFQQDQRRRKGSEAMGMMPPMDDALMAQHHHHHHQQQQQQQQQQQPQQPPPPPKKKARSRKKRVREPVDPNAPPKPKRKTGLNKPLILSPALSVFVGGDLEMSRPEIVKILWNYIKDNNLQDPADRRYILCDDKLKTIFDKPRINSFGMNRDLSAHLTKKPDAEIVEADSKPAVKDEMTPSISAADTGMNPTDTASSANSTGPGHDVLQAGPKATNAQHTSQGELVDTSPSVTAETPDVVTPREGESMLPTSTQANDNVQQQNHSHQHHSNLASPSTATTTTAGAASGTTPGAPSDHITSSGPSTNAAAIA